VLKEGQKQQAAKNRQLKEENAKKIQDIKAT